MCFLQKVTHFEHKIRPLLSRILPHKLFIAIYSLSRNAYLKLLSKSAHQLTEQEDTRYPQTLFKNHLEFPNDLANAAGFDKDGSLLEFNYLMGAGFAVVGTVLAKPHTGNLQRFLGVKANPWVPLSNSSSAINSLGLPNKGIDEVIKNIKSFKAKYPTINFPIALSVMGHPLDDSSNKIRGILSVIKRASSYVDFIEINESCPNCDHHDDWFNFQQRVQQIVHCRDSLDHYIPIFIKFNFINNPKELIRFLSMLKIDGLVISNTRIDYQELSDSLAKNDKDLFEYYTSNYQGGVSGQLIKEPVWDLVKKLDQLITDHPSDLKLIHVGGISSKEDLEKSRTLKNVILREWYTGLLDQMGTKSWSKIYSGIL